MRLVGRDPMDAFGADPLVHLDALYRLARHLARSGADAEDLVQETYARAFRSAGSFARGTDLRAWLFRILRNTWLDARRREGRARVDPDADLERAAAPAAEVGDG